MLVLLTADAKRRDLPTQAGDNAQRGDLSCAGIFYRLHIFNAHFEASTICLHVDPVCIAGQCRVGPDFQFGFIRTDTGQTQRGGHIYIRGKTAAICPRFSARESVR